MADDTVNAAHMADDTVDDTAMRPLDSAPGVRSSRSKWTSPTEGKLALIASLTSPLDCFSLPVFFVYSGGACIMLPLMLLFTILVAMPLLLLEVAVGQFMDRGTWCAWNIAPLFKGVGYLQTILNSHLVWLWVWCLTSEILFCYEIGTANAEQISAFSHCQTSGEDASYVDEYGEYVNMSYDSYEPCHPASRWSELRSWRSHGDTPIVRGRIDGAQVLVTLLSLLLVCGIVAAGKRVIGKLSAACVILPYLLTLMMFVRVLTLPGAADGLTRGFYPNGDQFIYSGSWIYAAAVSLSLYKSGRGIALTAGSHNRFNNNFLLDCVLAIVLKLVMGIFTGCVLIGASGVLAHAIEQDFDNFITGGIIWLPIVTEVFLVHTPSGGFWAACFLISLLLSAIIASVWAVESVVVAIRDLLPHTPRFRLLRKKHVLVAVFAVPWCGYGLGFCVENSSEASTLLRQSINSSPLVLLLCLLECAAVGWLYGARRFQASWAAMRGSCRCPYPLIFWAIFTPICLCVLLISHLFTSFFVSFVPALLVVIIVALVLLATRPGTFRQKWKTMTTPWYLAPHQLDPHNQRYDTIAMATVHT